MTAIAVRMYMSAIEPGPDGYAYVVTYADPVNGRGATFMPVDLAKSKVGAAVQLGNILTYQLAIAKGSQ